MIIDPLNPKEQELRAIDIHQLLPQQEPFVMVSSLVQIDKVRTVTELVIDADNLFVENDRLTTEGVVENIAQTCAARIGFVNKFILKKGIQIGFIGSIRNMDVLRTPAVGEKLTTTITVREHIMGLTLVDAIVKTSDETIVTAEMKIALSDQEMPNMQ
jgi:predicted hotdog family 3-hydroxylacyl-ACP dehydratase